MKTVEFYNRFHGSSVRVRVADENLVSGDHCDHGNRVRLSRSQQRRVERGLCGIRGCRCENMSNYWQPLGDDGWAEGGEVIR